MLGTDNPVKRCHIPEKRRLQLHRFESLKPPSSLNQKLILMFRVKGEKKTVLSDTLINFNF